MILLELFNILISFQSYINNILAKKFNIFVMIYPNDIFIHIKDQNKSYVKAI